jgi:hypothetical protein
MVRGMRGAGAKMQVERLIRGDLLGVGDELDRLVRQVLGQVIALLRGARRLDLVIVINQLREPLAGVTAQEPVEPRRLLPQYQRYPDPRPSLGPSSLTGAGWAAATLAAAERLEAEREVALKQWRLGVERANYGEAQAPSAVDQTGWWRARQN